MKYFKLILFVFSLLLLPWAGNEAGAQDAEITDLRSVSYTHLTLPTTSRV